MLEDDSSLGLIFATNLFIAKEPSSPDNTVTLFDTPGSPEQLTFNPVERYHYPSIQIRVRHISYVTGFVLAQDIVTSLRDRAQETWNGSLYTLIRSTGDPVLLDWDKNNRCRIVINLDIQRRDV